MAKADANAVRTSPTGAPGKASSQKKPMSAEHRNAWLLTGYGIFGLFLLGLIAYSVAEYAVR